MTDVTNVVQELEIVQEKDSNVGEFTGFCKWFNNKLGYGFITICVGNNRGKDIFVHHSGIKPINSNFNSLVKGEYVNFDIVRGINGDQATNITGINGGPLQCDHVYERKLNTSRRNFSTISLHRLKRTTSV